MHLNLSERVKPVSTRLPRLVARGCPMPYADPQVRNPFLRPFLEDGNPLVQEHYHITGVISAPLFPLVPFVGIEGAMGDSV